MLNCRNSQRTIVTNEDRKIANNAQLKNPVFLIKEKVGQFFTLAANKNSLIISVLLDGKIYFIGVDKECGDYKVLSIDKSVDDIFCTKNGVVKVYSVKGGKDYFYITVMPGYVNEALLARFGENSIVKYDFLQNFHETNSNPLIVKVRLKELN